MSEALAAEIHTEMVGGMGCIVLQRPRAMNALTLGMVREMTRALLAWAHDDSVQAVLVRGATEPGRSPAFCAGGDIRFFHRAALAGDPALEDFFTEEYRLNHLVFTYPKPYIALIDGVCMGGGMGIAQGAALRVVTERSKLAMPETHIGLFPDVGGGYFLSRMPGHLGEYLALTGVALGAAPSMAVGWADVAVPSEQLPALVEALCDQPQASLSQIRATVNARAVWPAAPAASSSGAGSPSAAGLPLEAIDRHFGLARLQDIQASLEAEASEWSLDTLATLRRQSPLACAISLELVRRGRHLSLAEDLRLERTVVRHCFHLRPREASETVEGIRALAVDKDHQPRWNPPQAEGLCAAATLAYFEPVWPEHAHPLRDLI
jgi:enoyl-CoA hydratase/carnithine racemase